MNNERIAGSEKSASVGKDTSEEVLGLYGEQNSKTEDVAKDIGEKVLGLYSEQDLRAELNRQNEDSKEIRNAFAGITGNSDFLFGLPYARADEECFSGDGASLFMLVKLHKEGREKTELVKIGWGEFSKQVFTKGDKSKYSDYVPEYRDGKYYGYKAQHEVLRSLPFDVYCVSQSDSYFADKETQKDMCFNPEKYLRENALFVARNGEVTMATKHDHQNHELEYEIKPISEEEAKTSINEMKELYSKKIEELSQNNQ